jgi:benzoyl-CoA reductase subunit C
MQNVKEGRGLAKVRALCRRRDKRARQLKSEGKKVIGYICAYVPLEIITALDMVPFRILGRSGEAATAADAHLHPVVCPFVRSCFDQALKGGFDFIDGWVSCHSCDTVCAVSQFWTYYVKPPFDHFLEIPHKTGNVSLEYFQHELDTFKKQLEAFAGYELEPGKLREAIDLQNVQRALVRELYALKKTDPPMLSGAETLQIAVALNSLPVAEGNALLREIMDELDIRTGGPPKGRPRLMIWGSPLDDTALIDMIETCGANVVMDDTCIGSRFYWGEVGNRSDGLKDLARHYLTDRRCPRTFLEAGSSYDGDLEERFGYLIAFARQWKVDGVILQVMKYCDTHGYEVPALKDYFKSQDIPVFYLEHEYSTLAMAPLRTRIEAFLEMIA